MKRQCFHFSEQKGPPLILPTPLQDGELRKQNSLCPRSTWPRWKCPASWAWHPHVCGVAPAQAGHCRGWASGAEVNKAAFLLGSCTAGAPLGRLRGQGMAVSMTSTGVPGGELGRGPIR